MSQNSIADRDKCICLYHTYGQVTTRVVKKSLDFYKYTDGGDDKLKDISDKTPLSIDTDAYLHNRISESIKEARANLSNSSLSIYNHKSKFSGFIFRCSQNAVWNSSAKYCSNDGTEDKWVHGEKISRSTMQGITFNEDRCREIHDKLYDKCRTVADYDDLNSYNFSKRKRGLSPIHLRDKNFILPDNGFTNVRNRVIIPKEYCLGHRGCIGFNGIYGMYYVDSYCIAISIADGKRAAQAGLRYLVRINKVEVRKNTSVCLEGNFKYVPCTEANTISQLGVPEVIRIAARRCYDVKTQKKEHESQYGLRADGSIHHGYINSVSGNLTDFDIDDFRKFNSWSSDTTHTTQGDFNNNFQSQNHKYDKGDFQHSEVKLNERTEGKIRLVSREDRDKAKSSGTQDLSEDKTFNHNNNDDEEEGKEQEEEEEEQENDNNNDDEEEQEAENDDDNQHFDDSRPFTPDSYRQMTINHITHGASVIKQSSADDNDTEMIDATKQDNSNNDDNKSTKSVNTLSTSRRNSAVNSDNHVDAGNNRNKTLTLPLPSNNPVSTKASSVFAGPEILSSNRHILSICDLKTDTFLGKIHSTSPGSDLDTISNRANEPNPNSYVKRISENSNASCSGNSNIVAGALAKSSSASGSISKQIKYGGFKYIDHLNSLISSRDDVKDQQSNVFGFPSDPAVNSYIRKTSGTVPHDMITRFLRPFRCINDFQCSNLPDIFDTIENFLTRIFGRVSELPKPEISLKTILENDIDYPGYYIELIFRHCENEVDKQNNLIVKHHDITNASINVIRSPIVGILSKENNPDYITSFLSKRANEFLRRFYNIARYDMPHVPKIINYINRTVKFTVNGKENGPFQSEPSEKSDFAKSESNSYINLGQNTRLYDISSISGKNLVGRGKDSGSNLNNRSGPYGTQSDQHPGNSSNRSCASYGPSARSVGSSISKNKICSIKINNSNLNINNESGEISIFEDVSDGSLIATDGFEKVSLTDYREIANLPCASSPSGSEIKNDVNNRGEAEKPSG